MNNDKIRHETMGKLYKQVKPDTTNPKLLIEIISTADELIDAVTYDKNERSEIEAIGEKVAVELGKFGIPFQAKKKAVQKNVTVGDVITHKVQILLFSHLIRLKIENAKLSAEQAAVAERAALVVVGILQLCAAKFWLPVAHAAIELRQAIVQATLPWKGPLGQLPHINLESVKDLVARKPIVACPRQLIELSDVDRRAALSKFSDKEFSEIVSVAEQYPIVRATHCHFQVIGEEFITASSIVTLTVILTHVAPNVAREEKLVGPTFLTEINPPPFNPREEPQKPAVDLFQPTSAASGGGMPTHCPYFPATRTSTWWVMMGNPDNGRLICLGKVSSLAPPGVEQDPAKATCKLQFQAPPQPGSWKFQVYIKNDSNMGCDMTVQMDLVVVDAPEISRAIIEDDISEAGSDTIAGQMAAIKSGKVGGEKKTERDDAEDSSDSDDEDG
ncbi:secretory subunit [Entophlyctis luteolus]|nr:secretory subunit [Entophlyctis luteolus]